jgi:hypothetical protein
MTRCPTSPAPSPLRAPSSWHMGIRWQCSSARISTCSPPHPPASLSIQFQPYPLLSYWRAASSSDQVAASLTSPVEGVALGDRPTTPAPWSFLDRYSELPSVASLLFAAVLPSLTDAPILSQPTPPSFSSCPDPNGVNVAPSAHYASPRLGGYGLCLMPSPLQLIRSSPVSCAGIAAHPYGGFFQTEEHPYVGGYYHPGCAPARSTSMGGLCPHRPRSPVMGGITFLLGTSLPSSTGVVHFPLALVSFPVHLHRLP